MKREVRPDTALRMLANGPVAIVGTRGEKRFNGCIVFGTSVVSDDPSVISVFLDRHHSSRDTIAETGLFSLNFPGKNLLSQVAFLGAVSDRKAPKLKICGMDAVRGKFLDVPVFPSCLGQMECRVTRMEESSTRIDAEVVYAMADEEAFYDHWRIDAGKCPLQHLGGPWYQSGGEVLQQEGIRFWKSED